MDHDDIDASEFAEYRICHACIGEDYLKDEVKKGGKKAKCAYCAKTAKTISVGDLADWIEQAFEDHYYRTSDQPNDLESMMLRDKESSYEWDRHDQKAVYAIAEAAKIEEKPAEHVRQVLGSSRRFRCVGCGGRVRVRRGIPLRGNEP